MRQTNILCSTSHYAILSSLRRLPLAPAGNWPFPTLSPQSLHRCLDPYPVASRRCICPFLPSGLRPHTSGERFGTLISLQCNFSRGVISRLQSFLYVQAPILVRPQIAPTNVIFRSHGSQAVYTTHQSGGLPLLICGITTCLNRAISKTGLSPVGLRPCRLLPPPACRTPSRQ